MGSTIDSSVEVRFDVRASSSDFHASFGGEKESGCGPAEQGQGRGRGMLDFYFRHLVALFTVR
jgi:hypothetical protein